MPPCRLLGMATLASLWLGCLAAPAEKRNSPKVHERIPFLLNKFDVLVNNFHNLQEEIKGFKEMGYLPAGKEETSEALNSNFDKLERMAALRKKFQEQQATNAEEGKTGKIVIKGEERPVEERPPIEEPIETPVQKTTKKPTPEDKVKSLNVRLKLQEALKKVRARYEHNNPQLFGRRGYDNRLYPPQGQPKNLLRPNFLSRRRRGANLPKRILTPLLDCIETYRNYLILYVKKGGQGKKEEGGSTNAESTFSASRIDGLKNCKNIPYEQFSTKFEGLSINQIEKILG